MSDDLSIPNPGYRGNRAGRYGTGPNRTPQRMDPDTRRLVMFAGGLGAVLLVLIGASALVGHRSGEVPVISPDGRPIRIKPANPGGMKIDGAENDVFSGGTDTANAKLAPAAETPDAKALGSAEVPRSSAVQGPASAAVAPVPGRDAAAPVAREAATPAPARPAVVASAPASRAPVASAPAAKPAPARSEAPAANDARSAAPGHQPMVQLAALASEDAAHSEWQQLSKRMPDLMSGRQPVFSRTERDGHTFWRVRTTGFSDVAQARAFCEHVRAKGGGCSVADF